MSKHMKRKAILMVLIEIICLVFLGMFLSRLQNDVAIKNQQQDMQDKVHQITGLIETADASAAQGTASYDEVYQAKAMTAAYLAQKSTSYEETDESMKMLADKMNITNLLVLDENGNVLAAAEKPLANFTYDRFNQLRTVFKTGEPSEAFTVDFDGTLRRYYAAKIDDKKEIVVEHDPFELTELTDSTNSWKAILRKINVGLEGFAFAVSSQDYTILYHPDEEMIGTDALAWGIDVKDLEDDHYSWLTLDDANYYCGVAKSEADNAYIICAVPEDEITSGSRVTVALVWFVFFGVITLVTVYAILLLNEEERKAAAEAAKDGELTETKCGKIFFNKTVAAKIGTIAAAGLVVVIVASFYMQTLFSISLRSLSNLQSKAEVEAKLEENEGEIAALQEQYNRRYLNKCQMAAYILEDNRQLWNREELLELQYALDVAKVYIFDNTGKEVVSSEGRSTFVLSEDPESQSYAFWQLLQGTPQLIQDAQQEDVSGEYYQYIGVTLKNEQGDVEGFVQIRLVPDKLEEALATTTLPALLGGVNPGVEGFAFAISKDEENYGTFLYHPKEKLVGRSAIEYGLEEKQIKDGYNDFITLEGKRYFASSLETEDSYIYVVIPEEEMTNSRWQVTLATGIVSFLCLLLVFLLLTVNRKTEPAKLAEEREKRGGPMMDVVMPDGSVQKTESITSRWSNTFVHWDDKTPEQRLGTVLSGLCSLLAVLICIGVLFKDRLFESSSIFLYIINGEWERGVSIFSITGCLMIICVGAVIMMLLSHGFKFLARTMGPRAATICRLLRSFVKYIGIIVLLYYCFALFGVDTSTLLASAGILSLVIGLGAQSLIKDILAGLFIIFEGEFRVGDIITIGDWRGTVMEIGVRTTKVESPGKDVKIFANSDVSGVINMTKSTSVAGIDVGIEYGESLERVESILATELPLVKKRVPSIIEGPYYKGVTALADSSVTIKIIALCMEGDRMQLTRDLNREMKIIFDKHDINIPFPQVVVNQPKEYQEATVLDKYKAEKFNEQQKELTQDMFTSQN